MNDITPHSTHRQHRTRPRVHSSHVHADVVKPSLRKKPVRRVVAEKSSRGYHMDIISQSHRKPVTRTLIHDVVAYKREVPALSEAEKRQAIERAFAIATKDSRRQSTGRIGFFARTKNVLTISINL